VTSRDRVASVADGDVAYRSLGSGPAVLIPWCNLAWPDLPVVPRLAERHHVILACPLGYQASTRLDETAEYGAARAVTDLLAVCDALGIEEFAVLGYSLTAAIAGWLATVTPRATRAVLGGFPLLGNYQRVLEGVGADTAALPADLGFDPRAAVSFYRDLAGRRDGALVTDARCPIRTFVGADDEIIRRFAPGPDPVTDLAEATDCEVIEGADHVSAVFATDAILRAVTGA
jgi:pimeloyl-ACP methyl ester carboxylesterase